MKRHPELRKEERLLAAVVRERMGGITMYDPFSFLLLSR